jgi:hypothetical protein
MEKRKYKKCKWQIVKQFPESLILNSLSVLFRVFPWLRFVTLIILENELCLLDFY